MSNSSPALGSTELDLRFCFHEVGDQQRAAMDKVRAGARTLAGVLSETCPPSRELSDALTNLEYVMYQGVAAIARRWG